jgi:hypothetical protein
LNEIIERQRREEKGKRLAGYVTQHRSGYYVRSSSSSRIYNVAQGVDGGWSCTCGSYKYRPSDPVKRKAFSCCHIFAVQWSLKTGQIKGINDLQQSRRRYSAGVSGRATRRR